MKQLKQNWPLAWHHTIKPIVLIFILFICFFSLDHQHFALYNPWIHGHYYRLLTGNFIHTNFNHLWLNCFGVILVWLFFAEHFIRYRYWLVLASCCIGSSMVGFTLHEQASLVGLSGALHGMFVYGVLRDIIEKTNLTSGWLILIGIWIKVILENTIGLDLGSENLIQARVAVEAHLSGCITGLILGIISTSWQKIHLPTKNN